MPGEEQEASLRLAIDATRAKDGSLQFTIAADQVKKAALGASDATDKVTTSSNKLGSSVMALTRTIGAYVAAYIGIKESLKAAMEEEDAQIALAAAINVTGDARIKAMGNLKEFATEMQHLTIYSDEQIMSEMAYAKNLGVTTNELKQATIAAMGLAAKYRLDLSTAMMAVGKAHEGATGMLARYGIVLDDTMTSQEKYDKIVRIGLDNFRLMTEQTNSATGSWKQIKNELNEVAEAIGKIALPAIKSSKPGIVSWLEDLKVVLDYDVDRIQEIPRDIEVAKENITRLSEAFAGWWTNAGSTFGNFAPTMKGAMVDADKMKKDLDAALATEQKALELDQRIRAMKLAKETTVPGAPVEAPKPPSLEEQKKNADTVLKLYQDMYNGMKLSGGDFYIFSQTNDTAYLEAFKKHLAIQRQEYEKTIKDKVLLDQWEASQIKQFTERNDEETRQFASERAKITAEMYGQMQNYGDDYFQAQKSLLDLQRIDYEKFIKDKDLLDKWYANQLQKISYDSSFTWQQFKGVVGETKGALSEFFMTFKNGENVLQAFGTAMQKMFANIAAEIAMYQALMALGMNPGALGVQNPLGGGGTSGGGGGVKAAGGFNFGQFAGNIGAGISSWMQSWFAPPPMTLEQGQTLANAWLSEPMMPHGGGIVGISSMFRRRDSGYNFIYAPRLHSGTSRLAPDEYRAILQTGEKVLSRADVARAGAQPVNVASPQVNVRIINVKDQDEIPEAMNSAKGEKITINHLRRNNLI